MGKKIISEKNNGLISIITDKRYRLVRHVILMLGFVMLQQSARILFKMDYEDQFQGNYGLYQALLPFVIFTSILYMNIYLLMPVFFKGRYIQYLLLVIAAVMVGLLLMRYISATFLDPYRIIPKDWKISSAAELLAATIFVIPIVLATSTARLMQKWIRDRDRLNELDKLTVAMELAALKNQINPHFLFNMLNNVNTLVRTRPDKASEVILKLSEFLRYQLYENNVETTSLIEECGFLSNFLNLEKIRRDNFSFTVNCTTPGINTANVLIPPNLFTTFVENAIKHSVNLSGSESYVRIDIATDDKNLLFNCTNSQTADETVQDNKSSGLGLANIKRRLELLYGNKYNLEYNDTPTAYTVTLKLPYELYYSR